MTFKNLLIAVIVILALGTGLYYIWQGKGSGTAGDGSGVSSLSAINTPYAEELAREVAEFDKIRKISLNFALFDDRLFKALHPAGQVASTSPERGRANPFLPF